MNSLKGLCQCFRQSFAESKGRLGVQGRGPTEVRHIQLAQGCLHLGVLVSHPAEALVVNDPNIAESGSSHGDRAQLSHPKEDQLTKV